MGAVDTPQEPCQRSFFCRCLGKETLPKGDIGTTVTCLTVRIRGVTCFSYEGQVASPTRVEMVMGKIGVATIIAGRTHMDT